LNDGEYHGRTLRVRNARKTEQGKKNHAEQHDEGESVCRPAAKPYQHTFQANVGEEERDMIPPLS